MKKFNQVTINWDFSTGKEMSYVEGCLHLLSFETHCLEFFNTNNPNTIVVRKDGSYISVKNLLEGKGGNTEKKIRRAHNIRKMLVAGALDWTPKNILLEPWSMKDLEKQLNLGKK